MAGNADTFFFFRKPAMIRLTAWLVILAGSFFHARAQSPSAQAVAKLDTNRIRIGEQTRLQLIATVPAGATVTFPAVADSIHKLEVLNKSAIDTAKSQDGSSVTYHQSLTVTGFDSGFIVVEPFTFFVRNAGSTSADSFSTEAMLLQVETVPVDTTKEIKDIKPPVDVPFTFREALPYIAGAVILGAVIFFVIRQLRNRKKKPVELKRKVPARPAHEIAIEELKKIEAQKLWQQGFYKGYHSAVSDTVRTYIENRFLIQAMEMPSDDTLTHLRDKLVSPEAFEKLKYVLQSADMVKFAKAIPVGTENEQSMQYALDFIMLTKPIVKEDIAPAEATKEKEVAP